jgi:hypothetical protein
MHYSQIGYLSSLYFIIIQYVIAALTSLLFIGYFIISLAIILSSYENINISLNMLYYISLLISAPSFAICYMESNASDTISYSLFNNRFPIHSQS